MLKHGMVAGMLDSLPFTIFPSKADGFGEEREKPKRKDK